MLAKSPESATTVVYCLSCWSEDWDMVEKVGRFSRASD
jgi:hypothetical protein